MDTDDVLRIPWTFLHLERLNPDVLLTPTMRYRKFQQNFKGGDMADKIHGFLPATAEMPTNRQRLIIRYLFGVLIDLVVLGLFDEFSDSVTVASFSWSLLAAVLLQALLKATIAIEHYVAEFFKARQGAFMKFMRFFGAWVVLFLSKFVILEAITFVFGDRVRFDGMLHGVVTLIIVVTVMVVAEEVIVRLVRWVR
ncbi:hypothetical protein P6U16_25290 (plasmid) [Rhizobium sp. 32-5/1]|uniref:hypothetical protein n=1 Tax=Rhizobium sp. 32-5/1 TaxID=3019602 RepID=UPI00240CEE34|nr:hypothetical protein [Rhizobium sp. 32-5/1]WEZ85415.1 hypothetical protein P6U16_25290 [Rhizobium sp. 32-5/1]